MSDTIAQIEKVVKSKKFRSIENDNYRQFLYTMFELIKTSKEGFCSVSRQVLEDKLGVSKQAIYSYREEAVKAGFLIQDGWLPNKNRAAGISRFIVGDLKEREWLKYELVQKSDYGGIYASQFDPVNTKKLKATRCYALIESPDMRICLCGVCGGGVDRSKRRVTGKTYYRSSKKESKQSQQVTEISESLKDQLFKLGKIGYVVDNKVVYDGAGLFGDQTPGRWSEDGIDYSAMVSHDRRYLGKDLNFKWIPFPSGRLIERGKRLLSTSCYFSGKQIQVEVGLGATSMGVRKQINAEIGRVEIAPFIDESYARLAELSRVDTVKFLLAKGLEPIPMLDKAQGVKDLTWRKGRLGKMKWFDRNERFDIGISLKWSPFMVVDCDNEEASDWMASVCGGKYQKTLVVEGKDVHRHYYFKMTPEQKEIFRKLRIFYIRTDGLKIDNKYTGVVRFPNPGNNLEFKHLAEPMPMSEDLILELLTLHYGHDRERAEAKLKSVLLDLRSERLSEIKERQVKPAVSRKKSSKVTSKVIVNGQKYLPLELPESALYWRTDPCPERLMIGERHGRLFPIGRSLRWRDYGYDQINQHLRWLNWTVCEQPLEESQLAYLIEDIWKRENTPEFEATGRVFKRGRTAADVLQVSRLDYKPVSLGA